MPIFKKNQKFLKIIMIFYIFLTSSCTLKHLHQNDDFKFRQARNQLKELIIPKEMNISIKNKEYSIPYQDQDLEKKNYDILPPV